MKELYTLIRERKWEEEIHANNYFFEVPNTKEMIDPETAMRDAVNEFLTTVEGKAEIKRTNGDYNWGDVVLSVPNEILNKYGLEPVPYKEVSSVVNQDEVLCIKYNDDFEVGQVVEVGYGEYIGDPDGGSVYVYIDKPNVDRYVIESIYEDTEDILYITVNDQEDVKELGLQNPVSKHLEELE